MASKRYRRLLSKVYAAGLVILLSLSFSPVLSASAQEKKQEVKGTSPASSIEEERLKILRADLQAQIDQLKKLKQELEVMSKGLEGKKNEQLMKVVKMFEAMPTEEAAKTLEKLDDETAVQILTSLKAKSAGKILGQVDSGRAAILSKKALLKAK
jgi:flagellar motility protein MotE (MotC chaperone)